MFHDFCCFCLFLFLFSPTIFCTKTPGQICENLLGNTYSTYFLSVIKNVFMEKKKNLLCFYELMQEDTSNPSPRKAHIYFESWISCKQVLPVYFINPVLRNLWRMTSVWLSLPWQLQWVGVCLWTQLKSMTLQCYYYYYFSSLQQRLHVDKSG